MAEIMTTKELAEYLRLHQFTIIKYAGKGKIPAFRIGRTWRFDKEVIDKWIKKGHMTPKTVKKLKAKDAPKLGKKELSKKKKRIF